MPKAISNTSPLLYLYRVGGIEWFSRLFEEVWIPGAVLNELEDGRHRGYEVPNPREYPWLRIIDPQVMPSEWLSLDLGPGELAAMALALENPTCVVLLDDLLARQTAQAAGLSVWGTLKIILEAKAQGFVDRVEPLVERLRASGMWMSDEIQQQILILAGEFSPKQDGK
jgi:hypothetical protein